LIEVNSQQPSEVLVDWPFKVRDKFFLISTVDALNLADKPGRRKSGYLIEEVLDPNTEPEKYLAVED
jgi:hypothetical protein